jgi:lysophospholipase L1-like esterase
MKILSVLFTAALASSHAMSTTPLSAQSPVIVALGDSTTAGTPAFLSPVEAPPDGRGDVESQYAHWLMRAQPTWRVLNRGVNGERSDQIRARLTRDVLAARPHVVVVIAGVNDVYQGRPADAVIAELREIYATATANGIRVVAGTIVPYNTATADQNSRMQAINQWIRRTADTDAHVWFCDTRAAVADPANPDRLLASPDGLHPTADGYRRMADALRPVIDAALRNDRR